MKRRNFLKTLCYGGAAAAAAQMPVFRAFAGPEMAQQDEFFIFIHAAGAWDVTVSLDPRNEKKGIIDPATSGARGTIDPAPIRLWKDDTAVIDGGITYSGPSFQLVRPPGNSPLVFGPGIGDLLKHYDRLTVFNGISMNTVSHQDGTTFSSTGRHLSGTKAIASSIDTMMADWMGTKQLFPAVSIGFPSFFIGRELDRRAVPLSLSGIGSLASSLRRSALYDSAAQRDEVNKLLAAEANSLADMSAETEVMRGFALQIEGLRRMNNENLLDAFTDSTLRTKYSRFQFTQIGQAVNAAFALETMRRNLVRCVSFNYGSFDTHFNNYRQQPLLHQRLFDMIAALVDYLDEIDHPTKTGAKLAHHTHIMVVSDFCRTPMINVSLGRDHYPNNSALVISPRFKGNTSFGAADDEQLLPKAVFDSIEGRRAIAPPDVLATFVSAFGADPRRYLRDGEVIKAVLKV
jgi:hypothetical protein